MKTTYSIKNFRTFGDLGTPIEFTPITILTGCNSSGKSSITKSVLLFDQYLKAIKKSIRSNENVNLRLPLDFNRYPINLLGRFDKIVNHNNKKGEVAFSFTADNGLCLNVVFNSIAEDKMNRGHLKEISISLNDDILYYSSSEKSYFNLIPLRKIYIENMKKGLLHSNKGLLEDSLPYRYFSDEAPITYESLLWTEQNNSFFKLPVFDDIASLNSNDFYKEIETRILNINIDDLDFKKGLLLLFLYISKEFEQSGCDTFINFFQLKEKKWLSSQDYKDKNKIYYEYSPNCSFIGLNSFPSPTLVEENWYDKVYRLGRENNDNHIYDDLNIPFPWLCTTLLITGRLLGYKDDINFFRRESEDPDHTLNYIFYTEFFLWNDFITFVKVQFNNVFRAEWIGNIEFIGSQRVDVKRVYNLEADNDFNRLLRHYFDIKMLATHKSNKDEGILEEQNFLNKWVQKFNIADQINLKLDKEGIGVIIEIEKNGNKGILADEGHGMTQLFSILLQIETAILDSKYTNSYIDLDYKDWEEEKRKDEESYDFSQGHWHFALHRKQQFTIIVEEPEIHLHPDFQSLLADMFVEAYKVYGIQFIIETHSEYLIRKLQILTIKDNESISREDVAIYYVENNSSHDVRRIGICKNGYLDDEFGTGFYDEATKLARNLRK